MYKALAVLFLVGLALADEAVYGAEQQATEEHPVADKGDYGYAGYHHGYGAHYYPGYAANKHREEHVNYYNGLRQHAVNAAAEHQGAGIGTARIYGAPGTPVGVHKHHGYGYGHYPYHPYYHHPYYY